MSTPMVYVSIPTAITELYKPCRFIINTICIFVANSVYSEVSIATLETISKPYFIFFN